MSKIQQLEQQLFDLDMRITELESLSNKILTKEKIISVLSNSKKYQTNFIPTDRGNGIKSGTELLVRIRGAKVVTGKISQKGQLLIIDQSHAKDEDNDTETINFKLKHRRFKIFNYNLPPGEYELHLWFYDEVSGERGLYTDKFDIIS